MLCGIIVNIIKKEQYLLCASNCMQYSPQGSRFRLHRYVSMISRCYIYCVLSWIAEKNGKIIWIRCDNYQDVTDSKLNLKTRKAISVCYVLYDDTKCAHNYVKYGLLDKHLASHSSCTNQCDSFCQNSTIYLCQIVGQLYQLIRPLWPYSIVTLVERFVL